MNQLTARTFTPLADEEQRQSGLGFLYLLSVPLGAGLATFVGLTIAGVNYTGFLWVAFLVIGGTLTFAEIMLSNDRRIYFPLKVWLPWIGCLWLSLTWCERLQAHNVQEALQISMPVLVGVAASMFVRSEDQLKRLLHVFVLTAILLGLVTAAARFGLLDGLRLTLAARSLGLTAALVACVFLAWFPGRIVLPLLGWLFCILLTVVTGSRMATLALLLIPAMHPLYRSRWRQVAVIVTSACLGLALFYTPVFQQRFFYEGSGTLTDVWHGDFLSFGRFESWPDIWAQAWRHPVLGAGVGSAYDFVPTVWTDMHQVHNDYLRVGFELGLVGLCLFIVVLLWQVIHLGVRIRRTEGTVRTAFAAAWLGMLVLMITSCTDNTLSYNLWYMNPLFAVMGAAYGVAGRNSAEPSARHAEFVPWQEA